MATRARITAHISVVLFTLFLALACAAEPLFAISITKDDVREFVDGRVADGRTLLDGGYRPIHQPAPTELSCHELYNRRMALASQAHGYRPPYTDQPRNIGAAFIGTLFTPGFYYLGYSALENHLTDRRRRGASAELDALRRASATQRCFE